MLLLFNDMDISCDELIVIDGKNYFAGVNGCSPSKLLSFKYLSK